MFALLIAIYAIPAAADLPTPEQIAALRAQKPTVILVSLDGVGYRDLKPERLPGTNYFYQYGAVAPLEPVFPTLLFPTHTSMITGTWPSQHGIVADRFVDLDRGRFDRSQDASWMEAEPLWVAAERQGIRTALYTWPGSGTDWGGIPVSYRVSTEEEDLAEGWKVRQIVDWISLPESRRPQLVVCYFRGIDAVSHENGPGDVKVLQFLKSQDHNLRVLADEIASRGAEYYTTLIVVSGYGNAAANEAIDVGTPLRERGIKVETLYGGGMATLLLEDPARRDEAITILESLGDLEVYAREALPAELRARHPRRGGHLVVITTPPYSIWDPGPDRGPAAVTGRRKHEARGMHGYRPEAVGMTGMFMALGRGVKAHQKLDAVRAIDVAPTVARLLGIDPPKDSVGTALLDPNAEFEVELEPAESSH